jgi:hypothetical protein
MYIYIYIYIYPSGTGWSATKSKTRYDRRSVIPYVLVPSPHDFEVRSYFTTDSQSVSMSWCLVHAASKLLYD